MNASKENARKANSFAYDLLVSQIELTEQARQRRMDFLRDFLQAAERKLPTEAAYERDQQRRKKQPA